MTNTLNDHIERYLTEEIARLELEPGEAHDAIKGRMEEMAQDILESEAFENSVRAIVQRRVREVEHEVKLVRGRNGVFGKPIKVINLTPHSITLYDRTGENVIGEIPMSDFCARVQNAGQFLFDFDLETQDGTIIKGIPFSYHQRSPNVELPDPKPGVYYIVSSLVLEMFPYREDLITINTSNDPYLGSVRDKRGLIQGSRSLRPSKAGILSGLVG